MRSRRPLRHEFTAAADIRLTRSGGSTEVARTAPQKKIAFIPTAMSAGKILEGTERWRKAVIFILVLRLDGPRLWSAIGLNKVDAVYFSHMHRPERVVSSKIAMIRSPDLSRNDGRYSRIAEFWAREPWVSRRGAAPARHQQRAKSRRNWPGVMPVPMRKARVKLAWEEKFSAMAISRRG